MFCTKCGKQLNDDARFCPHCAHPTKNAETSSGVSSSAAIPTPVSAGASSTVETTPASAVVSSSAPTATHPVNPPKEEGTPTGSTLGILGLIIGILSCVILFVMGPQAVLPAIIALVLCLVSLQKREVGVSRAPAIVGLCFSAFALFNALAFFGCVSMMIGADNSLRLLGMPV